MRQCEVNDWKESALQHLHVAAMLSCTTITMLAGVNSAISQIRRRELFQLCLKEEQGNALSEAEQNDYGNQLDLNDDEVPQRVKLAFNIIWTLGLGYGLAGLRSATRDNTSQPVLLEGGVRELTPEDFYKPFASVLVGEIRVEDLSMYSDPGLIKREETLHKLEVCEDLYDLRSHNTFAEGTAPLLATGLTAMNVEQQAATETESQGPMPSTNALILIGATVGLSVLWAGNLNWLLVAAVTTFGLAQYAITAPILLILRILLIGGPILAFSSYMFIAIGWAWRSADRQELLDRCFEEAGSIVQ